jgi:sugar transferase (PEP-CTERM/EpsH1 system associated)
MAEILYLVHRMPYPPDKGDKVRSYHLLQHLVQRHRVHLGTFIDDAADAAHLPALRELCADVHAETLHPRRSRIASLRGLLEGQPLTLPYYRSAALAAWVRDKVPTMDAALVFSSCMAQYTRGLPRAKVLLDLVDVDSAKWAEYAPRHRWPLSWLYRREGRTLLAWERRAAASARHTFLATDKEAELFRGLAPESAARIGGMNNGVDATFFAPAGDRASPFAAGERALVFTGAMDYWPNVDAVTWFVREALPRLRERHPSLRFYIVGRSPAAAVQALASEDVVVTGTVPDVRPFLQHAAVVVAPLRLARGIQNKVLEAMAMARPVVAAEACVQALQAEPGVELLAAREAGDYVSAVLALLADPVRADAMGAAGRQRVLASYDWAAQLCGLDAQLDLAATSAPVAAPRAHPQPTQEVLS